MSGIYIDKAEIALKDRIDKLFDLWTASVESAKGVSQEIKESFVTDGFYPGYLSQKVKVLFIGRESLGVVGDFMECLFEAYRDGYVGGKHLNKYQMHYLQFYVAYGFNHGFCSWDEIPYATQLAKTMGETNGLSFAFVNASKFTNWSNNWQLDGGLVSKSLKISKEQKFLARQIELLRPDVICSMNALGWAGDQIGSYEYIKELSSHDLGVHDYHYADGNTVPLLDMWHFSAPRKSPTKHYYDPIAVKYALLCERYPTLRIS